jgi:putative transposase
MTANQAVFPIATMSAGLGASRRGFYARRSRPPSARALADAALSERIVTFHDRSGGTHGAPRIHADRVAAGVSVGRKRVERLMRAAGIAGGSRRRFARTTSRDARVRPAAALVDRDFSAERPDALWVADITYIATWTGVLCLAVVRDAVSRKIVGWARGGDLRAQLVLDALNLAIGQWRSGRGARGR